MMPPRANFHPLAMHPLKKLKVAILPSVVERPAPLNSSFPPEKSIRLFAKLFFLLIYSLGRHKLKFSNHNQNASIHTLFFRMKFYW